MLVVLGNNFGRFRFGDFFDGKVWLADFVTLGEKFVASFDDDLHRVRKSVYGGGADTMQPPRGLIGGTGKLSPGVKFGHSKLQGGNTRGMQVCRNTTAVVRNRNLAVLSHQNGDILGVTGDGLVERVVKDFDEKMVEPFFVGTTDIHPRSFPDRFQSFEDGDVFGCVSVVRHGRGSF